MLLCLGIQSVAKLLQENAIEFSKNRLVLTISVIQEEKSLFLAVVVDVDRCAEREGFPNSLFSADDCPIYGI